MKEIKGKEIKNKLGVLLEFVRPGSGTSSTRNTARKFFDRIPEISEITGLNLELLFSKTINYNNNFI